MTFSNLVPDPLGIESTYVPRVFGFRVHKSARQRTSSAAAHVAAQLAASTLPSASVVTTTALTTSNSAKEMNPGATTPVLLQGVQQAAGELGEDAEKKFISRQGKRPRKETTVTDITKEATAAPTINGGNAVVAAAPPAAAGAPVANNFLTENPVKRRRRNNGSA
jgi:hypothetical protein